MSWRDLLCVFLVIVGLIMFLFGSNAYNTVLGWGGVVLIAVGFIAEIALQAYSFLRKRES